MHLTKKEHPFVLFYINKTYFIISCKYVLDIERIEDNAELFYRDSSVCGLCNSYGRIITTVNLGGLLQLKPDAVTGKKGMEYAGCREFILLQCSPLKALLVEHVVALVSFEEFIVKPRIPFVNQVVKGIYVTKESGDIVFELDIPYLLSLSLE